MSASLNQRAWIASLGRSDWRRFGSVRVSMIGRSSGGFIAETNGKLDALARTSVPGLHTRRQRASRSWSSTGSKVSRDRVPPEDKVWNEKNAGGLSCHLLLLAGTFIPSATRNPPRFKDVKG